MIQYLENVQVRVVFGGSSGQGNELLYTIPATAFLRGDPSTPARIREPGEAALVHECTICGKWYDPELDSPCTRDAPLLLKGPKPENEQYEEAEIVG
jgi:hypothetical protein